MTKLEPTRTSSDLTATERLRELLDERGVEYTANERDTQWWPKDNPAGVLAENSRYPHGTLDVYGLTSEQAVEATLGRGTCQQEEHGWSTEGDHARVWLTCGHDCMVETVADLPNYCPICGAEVTHA